MWTVVCATGRHSSAREEGWWRKAAPAVAIRGYGGAWSALASWCHRLVYGVYSGDVPRMISGRCLPTGLREIHPEGPSGGISRRASGVYMPRCHRVVHPDGLRYVHPDVYGGMYTQDDVRDVYPELSSGYAPRQL